MPSKPTQDTQNPVLDPLAQERRKRRGRNIAIGFVLGGLVLLFYVVTIVKLGPGVLSRAM
jgi:hypothetical protein